MDVVNGNAPIAAREPLTVNERAGVFLGLMDDAARGHVTFGPEFIRRLHGLLLHGFPDVPSPYRTRGIRLRGSTHVPPRAAEVPELMGAMCNHVQTHPWANACEASAYLHWRLTWIHPFADGNGRTVRAASFLLLCAKLGHVPQGTPTIMEQFTLDRPAYYAALRAADEGWKVHVLDLSELNSMSTLYLKRDLTQTTIRL